MIEVASILKLDGHTQSFQVLRIAKSIHQAFLAAGSMEMADFFLASEIAGFAAYRLRQDFGCAERLPISAVRNAVEGALRNTGHTTALRSFGQYPAARLVRLSRLRVLCEKPRPEVINTAQLVLGFQAPTEAHSWDRDKLIRSVQKEYALGRNLARRIAKRVEDRVLDYALEEISSLQVRVWCEHALRGIGSAAR